MPDMTDEEYDALDEYRTTHTPKLSDNGKSDKRDLDAAIADYEAALRINPNNANARTNLEIARQVRGY